MTKQHKLRAGVPLAARSGSDDEHSRRCPKRTAFLPHELVTQPSAEAPCPYGRGEYLLTLLLHHHPHNYSDELARSVPTPVPGIVRRAERFLIDNAVAPITVSDVADHLGISLRSLQAGFRQWRGTTPTAFLRRVRLQLVRDELLHSAKEARVTGVALQHGFSHLGRFSAQYRSAFGEDPSATLRRGRAELARL
jgi:AraC-like DNA-binding protein